MKNFVQPGDMLTVTAPAAVASGEGVAIGALFGVAAFDAAQNEDVEIAMRGVFDMDKPDGDEIDVGELVFWDAAEKKVTSVEGANRLVGIAVAYAAGGDATVRTWLNGFVGTSIDTVG
ncbi:hypothetical protein AUC68_07040 [Methyloceanibacter methanicus]|uniref:DUF2190 family protein n=1 Tax=Methyloceanibacter methanicus TaxID=1774968 RepID=A0A1E3VZH5_9HYPH|nr:DUF2190 family protein [Methyloceanibacter methanicus]ODR98919.1 hypothetical protein AUC68_07040 [Methyloceanibacter methanicus]